MSRFFKPYEGKRPYLFVSYSHRQSDEVVDTIRLLHERRWRVWYDEGIPAGSDWSKNIEIRMRHCAAVLFFLSKSALKSPNCLSEIKTALEQRKSVLVLPLEKAQPDEEWKALLEKCRFLAPCAAPQARAEAIEKSGFLRPSFRKGLLEDVPWDRLGLAASLLLFALTAGLVGLLFTGRIAVPWLPYETPQETPIPTQTPAPSPTPYVDLTPWESFFPVSFPDDQQERAIRNALDRKEGDVLLLDLPEIRRLYFCGNMTLNSLSGVAFDAEGNAAVNGARVIEGKVRDLSVIGRMPNLEALALIAQPAEDLGALAELTLLRELSLAGTGAEELGALGRQPSLETLHLEHSAVRELAPLSAMRSLRSVTVSAEMLPLRWDEDAGFDVILVP